MSRQTAATASASVASAPPATAVMPIWMFATIVFGLAGTSGLVALLAWIALLAWPRPAPMRASPAVRSAFAPAPPAPLLSPRIEIAPEPEPIAEEIPPSPPEMAPRRMPSNLIEPLPSTPGLIEPVHAPPKVAVPIHYSVRRLSGLEAPRPLRLAVSPVAHDDVGRLLKEFGDGYRFTALHKANLHAVETLKKYDVLFLTCSDLYAQDLQAAGPLRRFVEAGGTLYASDLQLDLLLRAFPEFRSRPLLPGVPQQVDARIVDPGLASHLGRGAIPLTFDAPHWRPAAFDPAKVQVLLRGVYRSEAGKSAVAPLLVKFRVKEGTVIFTSFHHTKNDSAMVRKLIEYLVFAAVSARSEARVHDLMAQHGFTTRDLRPLVLTMDTPAAGTLEHPGGGLQVALGFEHVGAKLKLTLRSPAGETITHADEGLYSIEIPDGEAGAWSYSITPVELPHAPFPLVLATGRLMKAP